MFKRSGETTEELVASLADGVARHVRKVLDKKLYETVCGFKLIVSDEVPSDEVWFIDSSGGKHVLKNANIEIKLNPIKGVFHES